MFFCCRQAPTWVFFIELKNPDLQLALIFPRNISLYMVFSLAADGANDNYNQFVQFAILHFSPNSFSSRGSYFKLGGEGSQILWIRCVGGCHTGCRWRCCVVCVGVRVRRCKAGLSHRVSLEVSCGGCRGQGSQIQDGAVTVRVRRSRTGLPHRVSLEV